MPTLGEASALKVGASTASKVYLGSTQVWPTGAPPAGDPIVFSEPFNSSDFWVLGPTATISGGTLNLPGVRSWTSSAQSLGIFDLTGAAVSVEMTQISDLTMASPMIYLFIDGHLNDTGNSLYWSMYDNAGTPVLSASVMFQNYGGLDVYLGEVTYDPVAHRFLRIREAAGTIHFEAGPDGTSWPTVVGSWVTDAGVPITGLKIGLECGFTSSNTNTFGTTVIDNVVVRSPNPRDASAPSTPFNLAASQSSTNVLLSWTASTDNVGVAAYRVYRDGALLATTTTTSYTDVGRPEGTYSYTVRAYDAAGNLSAASSAASITVTQPTTFVEDTFTDVSGTLLTAHTGEKGATWTKNAVANVGALTVSSAGRLYVSTAGGSTSNGTWYHPSGAPASNDYVVEMDVYSLGGTLTNMQGGPVVRASTTAKTGYVLFTDFSTSQLILRRYSNGTATDLWSSPADASYIPVQGGAALRLALRVQGSTLNAYKDGVLVAAVNDTALTSGVPALMGGTRSTTVVGTDNTGFQFDNYKARPVDSTPSAPNLAGVNQSGANIVVTWTASADDVAVTSYRIYRNNTLVRTEPVPGNLNWSDSGATANANNVYTVTAVDADGRESPHSPSRTVFFDTQAPTVPSNVAASVRDRSITVSWSASTDNVAVSTYAIYRNGVSTATVGSTVRSWIDQNVAYGTTNTYTVRARDAQSNESADSASASATAVAPTAPSGAVVWDTFTNATNTWLQNHTGETGATWARDSVLQGGVVQMSNQNRVFTGTAGGAIYYASGAPASANYAVEADFFCASATNSFYMMARQQAGANTMYYYGFVNGTLRLVKRIAGTATIFQSDANSGVYTAGSTHRLRLEVNGSTLTAYLNGAVKWTITDTAITGAGRPGILSDNTGTSTAGWHIDNFAVTNL